MQRVTECALAVAAGLLAGCAGDTGPGSSGTSSVREVSADEIHVVGTSESIARIADIQPAADGMVWVLNTVEPFFVALDEDGNVARSLGRQGGGPDEFRTPNVLVSDEAGAAIWAYDRAAHTMARITDPAETRTTFTLSRDSLPPGRMISLDNAGTGNGRYWVRPSSAGFLLGRARPGSDGFMNFWNMDIIRHTADGGIEVMFSAADHLADPVPMFGEATEFLPFPLVDACPEGAFVLYDPVTNAVRRFSDGALVDSVGLPAPRLLELTPDRLFSMIYPAVLEEVPAGAGMPDSLQLHTMLRLQWPDISSQMAATLPEYVDLRCTADAVWIQPLNAESGRMGRGPEWLRIDAEGTIERVELPDRFRPMRFIGSRIWGSQRGEFDVESVAWVDVGT